METEGLEDFLKGADPVEEVVTEPVNPEPEPQAASQPRNPDGTFASKGEPAAEPQQSASPAPENKPEPSLDHPALLGERRRRQEAEDRLRLLEQQFQQMQQPQQPATPAQPAQAPDPWEDPHGYAEWVAAQAVERAVGQVQSVGQQFVGATRFDVSEMIARSKFEDYDAKLEVFATLARDNPALSQQLQREADPAGFAYRYAKNHLEVQTLGSMDIEAIKAAARAEALAELKAQQPAPTPTVPTTLADAQSAKASAAAPAGPPSLADILKR